VTESYYNSLPPEQPQSSFATALAMLLYDISYLAWTQNVEVPLSQTGDVLNNLWSICCSSDLGRFVEYMSNFGCYILTRTIMYVHRRSHEATPLLPPPTPTSFPLDFAQLRQATNMNPASRARVSRISIPASTSSGPLNRTSTTTSSGKHIPIQRTLRGQKIDEEVEDDWDFVDEDVGLD